MLAHRVTAAGALRAVVAALQGSRPLDEVLAELLAQVRAFAGADETYILNLKQDRLVVRAADGLPRAVIGQPLAPGAGLEGLAIALGGTIETPSASADPRYSDPFGRPWRVGAFAATPIVVRDRVLGVLVATRRQRGHFGESAIWWLELLAGLAAVAIAQDETVRLEEHRARQAEMLLRLADVSGNDPDGMLPRLATAIADGLAVDQVDVLLYEPERRDLVSVWHQRGNAGAPLPPGHLGEIDSPVARLGGSATAPSPSGHQRGDGGTQPMIEHERGDGRPGSSIGQRRGDAGAPSPVGRIRVTADHPVADVFRSGRSTVADDVLLEPSLRGHYAPLGARTIAIVPVSVGSERRGVLHIASRRPGALSPHDLAFLQILADRVGLTIERSDVQRRRADARAREELIGVVSHELKTPVAVMQAYVELLQRRAERDGRESDGQVLTNLADQANRMLDLVEELLDVQRIDAGVLHLELSRFDLAGLAARTIAGLQLTTSRHRIELRAPEPVVVVADRRRIEEILVNLIENAIKYSPDGGEVTVDIAAETRTGREDAVVRVSDAGVGIRPEDQPHVFDRFYRAIGEGERLHRGHHGLGLGLYIARELVQRHGGEIGAESTPGQGSTFWFRLPTAGPDLPG